MRGVFVGVGRRIVAGFRSSVVLVAWLGGVVGLLPSWVAGLVRQVALVGGVVRVWVVRLARAGGLGGGGRWSGLRAGVAVGLALVLVASGLWVSGVVRVGGPSGSAVTLASANVCGPVPRGPTGGVLPARGVGNATVALPDFQEVVSPSEVGPHTVAFDGAKVVVKPGAVQLPVGIGITRLAGGQVAKLDVGMTNVTGAPRSGFRFTPHPMKFAADVEVTLPYDPKLIPSGMSAQDVYTFFYDDVASCWQVLRRASVDEAKHTVTSVTDHFTDMINATVTAPESPGTQSFNPNQMTGIQAANPAAGIGLIAPPVGNSQGSNQLSYPIEVPPGRLGMQPSVGISYNSEGSNGWLGVGWDLSTPAIVVDTRWGVPRYDPDTETETYLLGGEQLTPVAHRGTPVARSSEKVFHTRVEGGFARIVRHGDSPSTYRWEVTDKAGMRFFYGALPGATGPDAAMTLSGGDGAASGVFLWPLRQVQDTHGNFMRYHYVRQDDPGVTGGEMGTNLYVQRITYTGSGSTEGRYAVTFVRDRELNEGLRTDKSIDARGGFKRVTADLLRRIDVTYTDGPLPADVHLVRRYQLAYTTGAFHKTLLASIAQQDDQGATVATHDFDYFDDIRNAQGNYQAFSPAADWTAPADSLGNAALNRNATVAGDASAINANSSITGGGHVFVGVGPGPLPRKSVAVGAKVGGSHTGSEGVLALVDVDGDTLPDKVFRTGSDVTGDKKIWYRKNMSRPGGSLAFSATRQELSLPGIGHESSTSWVWGTEAYGGGVAHQLNQVRTSTTTSQYFSDVNADGIADLVNGASVLFGRLVDNVPVYGVDDDTPVPVVSRSIDTGLLGNLAPAPSQLVDANPPADTVRRWTAPYSGQVSISGGVRLSASTEAERAESGTADGVRVAVQKDATELWSATIDADDNTVKTPVSDVVSVSAGTRLYFRVQARDDGSLDEVDWDPMVSYASGPAGIGGTDVNGLLVGTYRASSDFTLAGRASETTVPLTGALHIEGDLTTSKALTDDVTVLITRDGATVFEQTIASGTAATTVPINLDNVAVVQGQTLSWRVKTDSRIDLHAISWVPRAYYTAADGVDELTDPDGDPLLEFFPPFEADVYPGQKATAPQGTYTVTTGEEAADVLTVKPSVSFDFDALPVEPSGRVAFTVKQRGRLLGKAFFEVNEGAVTVPEDLVVTADKDAELFFDFSTSNPLLLLFSAERSVMVTSAVNDTTVAVPDDFHSAVVAEAFPQPYRGWAPVGYNGGGARVTGPIVESELVVDDTFEDQFPDRDSFDPQALKDDFDANPQVTVPKVFPFAPSPKDGRWTAGQRLWVTGSGAGTSRLGSESVAMPTGSDFAGAIAVSRMSRSKQLSLTGSVSVLGGSVADGDSIGEVDFLDLNGDGFPDVVSGGGIQYTDPDGGLGAGRGSLPAGEEVRRSSNTAGNASVSAGSSAQSTPNGKGNAAPTGGSAANTAQAGNSQQPFGVSAGDQIGFGDSDAKFDLLDVNGDGLPDRVYNDGGVRLNYGYRFSQTKEQWRNPAELNDGESKTFGENLGFNHDNYGIAGGVSYSEAHTTTSATLADVNGDGLLDRVFDDDPIRVGFNTGNGFETPVDFSGSLAAVDPLFGSAVGTDQNADLGGGGYFTGGPCFLFGCVIINPGADGSVGASRTVQALRDINGDGFVDHLTSLGDGQLTVAQNNTGRTNLLRGVDRPLGGRIDVDYTRDGNTYDMPQSRWVLSKVSVNDGHTGDGQNVQTVTYEYSGGVYNRLEREFNGYATVTMRDRDTGANNAVYRSTTTLFRTDGHYTRGLPTRETTTDATGNLFTQTDYIYTLVDTADGTTGDPASETATIFPQLVRTDERFFEGETTAGQTTFTTMEYDTVGNLTRMVEAGDPGTTTDDVHTRIDYTDDITACQTSHIIGVPDEIRVLGGSTPILMRRRESTVNCTTGDVTQVRAFLDTPGGDFTTAVTDLDYFASGNLQKVTGPVNKDNQRYEETYAYDPDVDTHVASVTDIFGYQSTATYDLKFGTVLTSTDLNDQEIRSTYDSVGRVDTVAGPYEIPENRVSIDFEYHPEAATPYAVTRNVDRQADGTVRTDTIDTITFVDGAGRVIQTKTDAAVFTTATTPPANVMVVSGQVVYDAFGRAVQTRFPVTEPKGPANTTFTTTVDTVAPTETTFDVLDRVTETVLPDATTFTTSYGFGPDRAGVDRFETIATDRNNKSARTYTDVRGLTTAVKEFNPAGGAAQAEIWTSYGYDPLGQRTSITDDSNNNTFLHYDNFGRRTREVDPNSLATDLEYDLADNVTKKITSELSLGGQAIEYDYDFTRLKAIRYPVFTANNVTYTYGPPGAANNSAGRITTTVDGAGTVAREYGPLGEVTKETRTVPVGNKTETFTTQYQFDAWNRTLKLTYPDGEVLSYRYNSGGLVDGATGVKAGTTYQYLNRLDYDKFGQRALQETGNGTHTEYTYDPETRRLETLKANLEQGYTFQNLNYTYDPVGNITAISNNTVAPTDTTVGAQVGGPSSQTFTYDDLYRLTHAEGSYQPRIGDNDQYTLDLAYNAISNITNKTQNHTITSGGNTSTDNNLTYNHNYTYQPTTRPHAPTAIGAFNFGYDRNGNQVRRVAAGGSSTRQLIWDEENRLACDHENNSATLPQTPTSCGNTSTPDARYRYDDQGNRIVKEGAQANIYPNQNFSTRGNQQFKHIYIGAAKLLTKTVDNRTENLQFYTHSDHLGSTGFITDAQGQLAEHLNYIPGGETWINEHPTQPVPHQYTGKELDPETNLYYYGARYYDPKFSQWQSTDPALPDNATDTTSLSTYLYAAGNPLRFNDPDGREPLQANCLICTQGNPFIYEGPQPVIYLRKPIDPAVFKPRPGIFERIQANFIGRLFAHLLNAKSAGVTHATGRDGRAQVVLNSGSEQARRRAEGLSTDAEAKVRGKRGGGGGRLPQGGSVRLGVMGGLAAHAVTVLDILDNPSPENLALIAKGAAAGASVNIVARAVIGRSIFGPAGFFLGIRSDNAKYNEEQERRELIERVKEEIDDQAYIHFDRHYGDRSFDEARAHVINRILSEANKN